MNETKVRAGVLNRRLDSRYYLTAIAAAIVFSGFSQYLWQYNFPDWPLIKSQPPGVSVLLVGLGIAGILWLFTDWRIYRSRPLLWIIGFLAVTWALVVSTSIIHGDLFTHSVWVYVPILLMLLLKSPDLASVRFVLLATAWMIAGVIVSTRLLEIVGTLSMPPLGNDLVGFEQSNYWLPLSGSIGPAFRWPGPMGHNAMTGIAAMYLVVLGLALWKRISIVLIVVGVLTLLVTSSRVSMVATVIGVAVVLILGDTVLTRRISFNIRLAVVAVIGVLAVALALVASPNLTGRTSYWPAFVNLWESSPWIGVGVSGRELGDPLISQTNAHNIFLDILVLYGIAPLVSLTLALGGILYLAFKSAKIGQITPLAITVVFLVAGLTQADHGWAEPSEPWWFLILAVFMASAVISLDSASAQENQ